jgi:transposase-like protein
MYLYRAVDSAGQTMEFMLSPFRHAGGAECFFRKALGQAHTGLARVMNVDKNAAYPPAFATLQVDGTLPEECAPRPVKYRHNLVEPDHRFIKRRVRPGLGFWSCMTAWRAIDGYEAMNQLRKEQVRGTTRGEIRRQNEFIARSFGLAAQNPALHGSMRSTAGTARVTSIPATQPS